MATAATLATVDRPLAIPGGIVADIDLWFPHQQDPAGLEPSGNWGQPPADRPRYVVWVAPRPPGRELAPRRALHVNHVGRWIA